MARRRFFVPEIRRGIAEVTGADAEHLVRVLRVEAGQTFEISDNARIYLAQVRTARKSLVEFAITQELPTTEPAVITHLYVALFKFDHLEWLVEKATELGVASIQPLVAVRSERGLAQAASKRHSRWQKIALEASQQSRRAHLPRIEPVLPFAQAIRIPQCARLFLDENSEGPALLEPLQQTSAKEIALLLGPEGGWTEDERAAAIHAGWVACSLGPTILRAETAGIAALAIINADALARQ